MDSKPNNQPKSKNIKKVIRWVLVAVSIIVFIVGFYLYQNFNRLLSNALVNSFNSNIISEVYELKFEKLRVNFITGNINVLDVILQPRATPIRNHAYINSSLKLETKRILLEDIRIMELFRNGKLNLKRIEIYKPNIEIGIGGDKIVLFPFADSTSVSDTSSNKANKFVNSFSLSQFNLVDASFQSINTTKQTEFRVQNLSISLNELKLYQESGKNLLSIDHVNLDINDVYGRMQKGALRSLNVKDFNVWFQKLEIQESQDTLTFHFSDFETEMKNLDVNTSDSIYNVSLNSMTLSYTNKSLNLKDISYKPNVSQKALLGKEKYQKMLFSLSIGSVNFINLNFDSLVYNHKLFVDDINMDSLEVSVFKDKTKPVNTQRFPEYPGQKLAAVPIPFWVTRVTVIEASVHSTERRPDSSLAKVKLQHGKLELNNITNLSLVDNLTAKASAYLEGKVRFTMGASCSYIKPYITFNAKTEHFNFTDLNRLLTAYTPAKIKNGTVDGITFSGTANSTGATGTMKVLFHNMDIDLNVSDKKWVNSFLSFSANSIAISNNPTSDSNPPRIVTYNVTRDINKGAFNIILKSLLAGTKETFIMSKENKKAHKDDKKNWKKKEN